ncbi:hypothetical protein PCA31118_05084 [Pandoraea captiosa]|uniref:Uncharacterized protein n=1 Tax=Pandoraea captiosa TaxID=2508302 RepID=A0A5E5ASW2_9BURK|nr:hypothetical protein [Pandoraea captiosa]VVE75882.1 hypothetical protein PCA31118_05084 [Pandoraea captiosa]
MQAIELSGRWNFPTITVGDEPIKITADGFAVYDLLSAFQDLKVTHSGFYMGTYKHVALRGGRAYVFDFERNRVRAPLGLVTVHKR